MLKGSCLCNAIRYEIHGELGPTMMCHCSKCRKANGSPLVSRRPSQPDLLRLRIGTLDTPVQLKPVAHIFVGSKAPWDEIHDDIPQYAERP